MITATASPLECPMRHEGFQEPNLLPYAHLVCHNCVLSWLLKGGKLNGCPLCWAPILLESLEGQGNLASQVDSLPTSLAIAIIVEREKTLSGVHVCNCENEGASLYYYYCLQCAMKFCSVCVKSHAKIPATQDHVTEKLSNLSAEHLATQRPIFCAKHSGKPGELSCTDHEELICLLCASSSHRHCSELKGSGDVAPVKREELRSHVHKLKDTEIAVTAKIRQLDTEISDGPDKFNAMRALVKAAYDELQNSVEAERQKLNAEIQVREDIYLSERKSSKLDLEILQATLSAHTNIVEQVEASALDTVLLGMIRMMKDRLDTLESGKLPNHPNSTPGSLQLTSATVDMAKKALAAVGMLKDFEQEDRSGDQLFSIWTDTHEGWEQSPELWEI